MTPRRKVAADQGTPRLEDGTAPLLGQRVLTHSGHRGTVLWSTSPSHSVSRQYPAGEVWHTLVRFPDRPARPYPTTTLRPDPEPTACPSSSLLLAPSGQP